jgi:branched-chain amino acid transport system ATP-binding protein
MLDVQSISAGYDGMPVLTEVSLTVPEGQIISILGSNGAGKTTLLKTISALLRPSAGRVVFRGIDLTRVRPHEPVKLGIAHVPEGRRIFGRLTVGENLLLGGYTEQSRQVLAHNLERVYDLFPILKERQTQPAGTLSGGQQQMLAIGRGLMASPKLLILDEPSLGLMPLLVKHMFITIQEINRQGTSVLLVEQNVKEALEISHRAYVLQTGRIRIEGTAAELLHTELVRKAYLGI